ncbi:MAG: hypothetical protein U0670_02135 [Anaerolineae bacterium]
MTKRILFSVVLALVVIGSMVGVTAQPAAQEMMTHTCDSTLIVLLYIAEHDYGFHSMMDVSTFEKGQYAPLFDAMMMDTSMGDMMATEEAMMPSGDMMATEDASMMGGDMMMLTTGNVAGEDEACTALRAEVEAFLYGALTASEVMESGS